MVPYRETGHLANMCFTFLRGKLTGSLTTFTAGDECGLADLYTSNSTPKRLAHLVAAVPLNQECRTRLFSLSTLGYNEAVEAALNGYNSLNPNMSPEQAAQLLHAMADSLRQHLLNSPMPIH